MTPQPRKKMRTGVSPEWSNLPRRKCDDCGKSYKPARPLREGQRGFCSDNCRKSYHKHGGAYRKLKGEIAKLIHKELAQRFQLEEPCEYCNGKGVIPLLGTISKVCPKCIEGAVLTHFGKEVIDFIQRKVIAP